MVLHNAKEVETMGLKDLEDVSTYLDFCRAGNKIRNSTAPQRMTHICLEQKNAAAVQ